MLRRSSESIRLLIASDSLSSLNSKLSTLDGLTKQTGRRNAAGGTLTVCLAALILSFVITQLYWFFSAQQQQITVPQLENDASSSVPVCGGCGTNTVDIQQVRCSVFNDKGVAVPLRPITASQTAWGRVQPENLWTNWSFLYGCTEIKNRDLLAEFIYRSTIFVNRSHTFTDTPVFVALPLVTETVASSGTPPLRVLDSTHAVNSAPFVRVSPVLDRYYGWVIAAYHLRFITTEAPDISFLDQAILGEVATAEQATGPITTAWQYFPIGERQPIDCLEQAFAEYVNGELGGGWQLPDNSSSLDCVQMQYILGGSRFVTTYQSTRSASVTIGIIGGFAGLVIGCAKLCLQCSIYALFRAQKHRSASTHELNSPTTATPMSTITVNE